MKSHQDNATAILYDSGNETRQALVNKEMHAIAKLNNIPKRLLST